MEVIKNFLECGYINMRNDILDFKVVKFDDIVGYTIKKKISYIRNKS